MKVYIELEYNETTTKGFTIEVEGKKHEYMALIEMVTRGTLMASMANKATAYNEEGFDIVSYRKN